MYLAFTVFVTFFLAFQASEAQSKKNGFLGLACGTYRATGDISLNSNRQFLLQMNSRTTTASEFLLLGRDLAQKLRLTGRKATVEFYVPNEIDGTMGDNFVFVQSASSADKYETPEKAILLEAESCGNHEKFHF